MKTLKGKKLNILAFGAHPGPYDAVYQAGGTMAKYAKAGHHVILVSAADEWEGEMKAMAKTLGCKYRFLDFEEGAIFDDPVHVHKVMDLIREVKADVVLTHQPTDYHPDHRALSRAVLAACLLARVGEIIIRASMRRTR